MPQDHATHTDPLFSCLDCCRAVLGADVADRVEALATRWAEDAPAFTPEQRDRLAVLLRDR